MAAPTDNASMALFCDFENIALGVRDAQYEKFDIRPVLERLLARGSIVVKKAYCDWDRYKAFKATMHEANFELIEIPHVRQSGKNSADIRLVVDALDLCYTKSHVDTFVIISGDSDFSPLVSKLRENAKQVIGVGVKQSTSDLLIANCDEFIYYDDLVRDSDALRAAQRRGREKRSPDEEKKGTEKVEARKTKAVELAAATFADLIAVRGDGERVWASVLKEVIKRRNPGFNETYFGFRTFGNLLEEAARRGLLVVGRDEKSGTFVTRALPGPDEAEAAEVGGEAAVVVAVDRPETPENGEAVAVREAAPARAPRRRGGRARREAVEAKPAEGVPAEVAPAEVAPAEAQPAVVAGPEAPAAVPAAEPPASEPETEKPARKRPARAPRPRKPKAVPAVEA